MAQEATQSNVVCYIKQIVVGQVSKWLPTFILEYVYKVTLYPAFRLIYFDASLL